MNILKGIKIKNEILKNLNNKQNFEPQLINKLNLMR